MVLVWNGIGFKRGYFGLDCVQMAPSERPWIRVWLAGLNRPFPSCSKPLFQSAAISAKLLIWNLFQDNEGKRFKKSFSSRGSRYHNSVPGEREISSVNREEIGIDNCLILGETKLVLVWVISKFEKTGGSHLFPCKSSNECENILFLKHLSVLPDLALIQVKYSHSAYS